MKRTHVSLGAMIALSLSLGLAAMAQDTGMAKKHRHHHGFGFGVGVCVGQTLATQTPPVLLTPGQAPTAAQKSAIQTARTTCKAQFKSIRAKGV